MSCTCIVPVERDALADNHDGGCRRLAPRIDDLHELERFIGAAGDREERAHLLALGPGLVPGEDTSSLYAILAREDRRKRMTTKAESEANWSGFLLSQCVIKLSLHSVLLFFSTEGDL